MSVVVEIGRAASWNWDAISAVATAAAVIVALFVGIAPVKRERRRRKKQTLVYAKIVADGLTLQEVYLRTAMRIPGKATGEASAWEFEEICELMKVLDAKPVAELVAFSSDLPGYVGDAIAECAAHLSYAQLRRPHISQMDVRQVYDVGSEVDWYGEVADKILSLRKVLHLWIGSEPQDISKHIDRYVVDGRSRASRNQRVWLREQIERSTMSNEKT
ncbi:hypothetical protein CR919_15040 [Stenotrophomonas sp. LMG 10879]|uniref:hypothetical protein n=1 Tax=Stenotrophomonas sp. LMG 10879 TaxID=487706 RepID=UPI000C19FF86|nr:hypothetical protein [Stenotrophomonas sp. LMG 10879]PII19002.1 hypothetical protein CR919_15040 [Stenotrophomonas sp. LMG 10879]